MTTIADLLVCKDCKNVFTNVVGSVRTHPAQCPVCKSTSHSKIAYDL